MISAGIILVHAFFHEAQAEHAGIEIEILLGRPGNRRHVMEAFDFVHESLVRFRASAVF